LRDDTPALGIVVRKRKLCTFSVKCARNPTPDSGRSPGNQRAIFPQEFAQRRKSRIRRTGRTGVTGSIRSMGVSGSR
jgi:hypothetical protein